jgi:glutaredoxin 3
MCPSVAFTNILSDTLIDTTTIASILCGFLATSVPPLPTAIFTTETEAKGIINAHHVPFFSKSSCPSCKAPKTLFNEKLSSQDKNFLLQLDHVEDGAALQDALEEIARQRSVPTIFLIAKGHIDGNIDLQAMSETNRSRLIGDKVVRMNTYLVYSRHVRYIETATEYLG